MKKCYMYSKIYVIMTFGSMFVVLFCIFAVPLLLIGIPKTSEGFELFIGALICGIIVCSIVLVWIFNILKVKIYIDEDGIRYTSLFKTNNMIWKDILCIEKKYFYSGAYTESGPPKDLEIRDRHNNKLKIFYFLENCTTYNVEEGMAEFEAEIRKHIGSDSVFKG